MKRSYVPQRPGDQHRQRSVPRATGIALSTVIAAFSVSALPPNPASAAGARAAVATKTGNAASNPLPAMSVTDVRTGKAVRLQSALNGRKPLLVWFWAPN